MFEEKREAVLAIEAAVLPLMPKAKAFSCLSPCYAGPIEMSIPWKIDATKVSVS